MIRETQARQLLVALMKRKYSQVSLHGALHIGKIPLRLPRGILQGQSAVFHKAARRNSGELLKQPDTPFFGHMYLADNLRKVLKGRAGAESKGRGNGPALSPSLEILRKEGMCALSDV